MVGEVRKDKEWIGGGGGLVVISQRRGKCRREGWKCEGWLDRSPAGNQEEAADESWGVLALLLSCSLLPPVFLAFSPVLLSDCRKAPARPLTKPNPFPPSLPSLSSLSLTVCLPGYVEQLFACFFFFSALFPVSCSSELCWHDRHHAGLRSSP